MAVATGSIAGVLFCGVFGITFLISYEQALANRIQLEKKADKYSGLLSAYVLSYLEEGYQIYLSQCALAKPRLNATKNGALDFIINRIRTDRHLYEKNSDTSHSRHTSLLLNALLIEHDENNLLTRFVDSQTGTNSEVNITPTLRAITEKTIELIPKKPFSVFNGLKTAFIGAMATFGSIAGCSAGFMGLLSGLGLISGFTVVPVIGWSVLAVAAALAGTVAIASYQQAADRHLLKEVKQERKNLFKDFEQLHHNSRVKLEALELSGKITTHQSEFNHSPSSGFRHFIPNKSRTHSLPPPGTNADPIFTACS